MTQRERDIADATINVMGTRAHWQRVCTIGALFAAGAGIWLLLWWAAEWVIRRLA